MDLMRIHRTYMHSSLRPPLNATVHAGSIFDLEEDTDYELRLVLTDPDGGGIERLLTARTWKEPSQASPSRTLHVVPGSGGGSGTSGDPFRGLAEADAAAQPGDLVLVHDGTYTGSFTVTASGAEGAPIAWQAAAGEYPVLDANGSNPVLRVQDAHDLIFEGLELRDADWGIILRRCQRVTFRRLYIHQVHTGIDASVDGTNRHLWMSDNVIEGGHSWPRASQSGDWRGIKLAGEGVVVCHNRISNWWDGIDTSDAPPTRDVDIYLNEISECIDDGIELDFSDANARAFENRLTNCFQGISFQPVYGGPAYAVRNSLYNVTNEPFKLHNSPSGVVLLHNTVLRDGIPMLLQVSATIHNVLALNNLFVARAATYAIDLSPPCDDVLFDHDVYCGGPYNNFGKWIGVRYDTLPEFAAGTGMETNGVHSSGYNGLFVSGAVPPSSASTKYALSTNDLRPAGSAPAVDAGCVLYNVNDGYAGSGPDAGCLEAGDALPAYGPR